MTDTRPVWLTEDEVMNLKPWDLADLVLARFRVAPADQHAALSYLRNHTDPRTDRDFVDTVLRALGMPSSSAAEKP